MQFCGNLPLLYLRADTHNRASCALLRERDTEKESADAERLELIKAMREEGKTLQEIADLLGYKNRSSVSRLLNE